MQRLVALLLLLAVSLYVTAYLLNPPEPSLQPANASSSFSSLLPSSSRASDLASSVPLPSSTKEALLEIAKGTLHLVDLSQSGTHGQFCSLDWEKYRADPSLYPMFKDLVKVSSCSSSSRRISIPLSAALQAASSHDAALGLPSPLPAGFVFHESRCGSTLAANSLAVSGPHRVYSESSPIPSALKSCTGDGCEKRLRGILSLMSRTGPAGEKDGERVFFKFQSILSLQMGEILEAAPEVPWIFVYRVSRVECVWVGARERVPIPCFLPSFSFLPPSLSDPPPTSLKGRRPGPHVPPGFQRGPDEGPAAERASELRQK